MGAENWSMRLWILSRYTVDMPVEEDIKTTASDYGKDY